MAIDNNYYEDLFNEKEYTVDSVASILEVKAQTVYNWINEGKIKTKWKGAKIILREEIIKFCKNRE